MDQTSLNSLNDALTPLAPYILLLLVLGAVISVVMIAYAVRLWRVQSATFQIKKDVEEIREHILGHQVEGAALGSAQTPISNNIEPLEVKKSPRVRPLRRPFIWLAVSIPILIALLIVIIKLL